MFNWKFQTSSWFVLSIVLLLTSLASHCSIVKNELDDDDDDGNSHYSNTWVVKIRRPNYPGAVDRIARQLGYINKGKLMGFTDHYLMKKIDVEEKSKRSSAHLTRKLIDHPIVEWAEQMVAKRREKRDRRIQWRRPTADSKFNDPLWPKQWYMHDTRLLRNVPEIDLNVLEVWKMGYTGKGVVVSVIDDGLEWNHTDIIKNYDPKASYDANDDDEDPMARYDELNINAHGTRCAGEIAMVANNKKCGVGVAYNAKIGGIRMLDGTVTDATEGVSLGYNIDYIDIFSASWGPTDDGKTLDGPGTLATKSFEQGVTKGRNGKGVIYVWASGNGGGRGDNCNCDGYTSSIYTLSIGSASQHGLFPWYGEMCASTMASTYSSGAYSDQKISTADLRNKCTMEHTGTSASAPLAAGILALVLEANGNITWRDAQHLVIWTSSYEALKHNHGWHKNARGFLYNTRFGFGLMNATAMVLAAKSWKNVPTKSICLVEAQTRLPLQMGPNNETVIKFESDGCKGIHNEVKFLEHTQVQATIKTVKRGTLKITLTSPSGTKTTLLTPRKGDKSQKGFKDWLFMSVHLWGEDPVGEWTLKIINQKGENIGTVSDMKLILHGTKELPNYLKSGPRQYKEERYVQKAVTFDYPQYDEDEDILNSLEKEEISDINSREVKMFNENENLKHSFLAEEERRLFLRQAFKEFPLYK